MSSTICWPVSTPTTPGIFIAADDIDALDLGMGVRAADEMGVGHAQHLDVVDVAALAGDETSVFLAHDACANAFNAHGLFSQPEFLISAISIEIGGLEFGIVIVAAVYSAACDTFMRPAASSTDLTML